LGVDEIFPANEPGIRVRRAVLADGVGIRIAESGDPAAPPVLLVHGWGASIYMWRAWFAPFAAAGFRVLAIDLPGHGLSDKPTDVGRYGVDRMVATLREVVEIERLGAPHVVGQSMGGAIALEAVLRGELTPGRLILVNPASFGRVHLMPLARRASPRAVEPVLERIVPRWIVARGHRRVYGDPSRITEADIDQYWAPSQFPGYASAMRRLVHEFNWIRASPHEMAARLRSLTAPTAPLLVVLGTKDRVVRDARPYVAQLRKAGAPLEVFASVGGGHAVNEERPEEIIPLSLQFIRRAG
jgi:pimeloyl-ACP methyl ester carboxylesterase